MAWMKWDEEGLPSHTYQKQEMPSRIKADTRDRETLMEKLERIIDSLDPEQHQGLVNVVTRKVVCHSSVNVNNAIMVGKKQMETFEQSWPDGFHDTIPRKVVTMSVGRKSMRVGDAKVFDTKTMYARAMALQARSRSLNINDIISHELAPYPASMFKSNGQMRDTKSKACLKNILRVDVSNRHAERDVEEIFLNGCAVLYQGQCQAQCRTILTDSVITSRNFWRRQMFILYLTDIKQTAQMQVQGMGETREQAECIICDPPHFFHHKRSYGLLRTVTDCYAK